MKADFNKEVMALVDTFNFASSKIQGPVLYIRYPLSEVDQEDVYAGFVKTVKNSINRSIVLTEKQINNMKAEVKQEINEVNVALSAKVEKCTADVNKVMTMLE